MCGGFGVPCGRLVRKYRLNLYCGKSIVSMTVNPRFS
jgi:hypothetical protein